ncbi:helix-turn-helix domain-containing protein [Roseibium sp. CAU 1637]|uniref:Helix-turn-helix domain-containing protein n=1 Tax=Roseibium limicola TaxID=2816037 RepID=A0A939EQ41_9HYPH|nr:helix-turn-helix domain-containing protein [Roseibium limicola]MBO0346022.1 helix-turn-helix domain-containing protein [Roseibium limicola]
MTVCPAHIEAYVEILGEDLAVEFFLAFGGTELYFGNSPSRSMIVKLTGAEKMVMLTERLGVGFIRIPIPKPWIAAVLIERGLNKAEIARKLHVDQTTVRRWFARKANRNQLSFFEV